MQFEYHDWIAEELGEAGMDEKLKEIFEIIVDSVMHSSWIGAKQRVDRLIAYKGL